ncbi:MAG: hypothetical protein H0Z29_08215 [Candidatus Marinimicrobia bacterium]|nr:hypothetical protein [Candidatus Neomarinimicrobiota bacterium]
MVLNRLFRQKVRGYFEGRRFRFRRITHDTKRMTRPMWWLIAMALIVLALIYYLNKIAR